MGKRNRSRLKEHKHVIVQRGRWNFLFGERTNVLRRTSTYASEFLCEPKVVENTTASGIAPAIDQAAPKGLLDFTTPDVAVEMVKLGTHTTILTCDAASSNNVVCRMKHRQHRTNVSPRAPGHFLLTERCQAHAHNNGKKVLPRMRHHLGRMYSISKINRLGHINAHRLKLTNHICRMRFQRKLTPPPQDATTLTLWKVADAIFDFNADHHVRKKMKNPKGGVAHRACPPLGSQCSHDHGSQCVFTVVLTLASCRAMQRVDVVCC